MMRRSFGFGILIVGGFVLAGIFFARWAAQQPKKFSFSSNEVLNDEKNTKQNGDRQANLIKRAMELYELGQEDQLQDLLSKELLSNPDTDEFQAIMADFLIERENYSASETFLKTLVAKYPNNNRLRTSLAEVLGIQGKRVEALEELDIVLIKEPGNWNALAGLSSIGGQDEALKKVEQLVEKNPNNGNILSMYARLLKRDGHLAEAESYLRLAAVRDPVNARALAQNAVESLLRKDFDSALEYSDRGLALRLSPDRQEQMRDLHAQALMASERWSEAADFIETWAGDQPTSHLAQKRKLMIERRQTYRSEP